MKRKICISLLILGGLLVSLMVALLLSADIGWAEADVSKGEVTVVTEPGGDRDSEKKHPKAEKKPEGSLAKPKGVEVKIKRPPTLRIIPPE